MDKISLERAELLHPKVRKEVTDAINHINKFLLGKGVRMRITQGLRTIKEQDELYAQGRTKPGKIITNAKGGQSYHNVGLAVDFVILHDKDGDGSFESISWAIDTDWMKVVNYFKSLGWAWGGDFKSFKDNPHLEKTFGRTVKSLATSKDTISEVIGGVKYTYPKL